MPPLTFGPLAAGAQGRQEVLKTEGPLLDIIIHREHNAPLVEGVQLHHETRALIDTGASDVCIDYRIAHALNLREINQTNVTVVGGTVPVSVYLGVLEVPALGFKRLMPLYASKVARINYNALLGRSFLTDFVVTFDGPNGCFHFYNAGERYPLPPDDE